MTTGALLLLALASIAVIAVAAEEILGVCQPVPAWFNIVSAIFAPLAVPLTFSSGIAYGKGHGWPRIAKIVGALSLVLFVDGIAAYVILGLLISRCLD